MLEFMSKSIIVQRKKMGLTQEELAEKLEVSAAAISKWERGISTPELSMVCKMADCFGISVDDRVIQLVLRKLNSTTLVYALVGASGIVIQKFMENLSGRRVYFLDRCLEAEEFDVEKTERAQRAVLQIYLMIK